MKFFEIFRNKFNQTMTAANSLPIFYNLLNNNNKENLYLNPDLLGVHAKN